MKATDVITRALGLAALENSQFITYDDKSQSLFETYRDLYMQYVKNDSDYFVKDVTFEITSAMQDPNMESGLQEFLLPMPTDCMTLRYVDYIGGGGIWQPMDKFPIGTKDIGGTAPRYRWQNDNLWIIGSSSVTFGTVRVGYYPSQPIALLPDDDIVFGADIAPVADVGLVTYPIYVDSDIMLYVYNGTVIKAQGLTTGLTSTLYTATTGTVTWLQYFGGYVYFVNQSNIYRASTDFVTTITPTAIVSTADVLSLSVSPDNLTLYYAKPGATWSAALDGTGAGSYQTYQSTYMQSFNNSQYILYVDTSGNVKEVAGGAAILTNVSQLTTDGSTYVFYRTTGRSVYSAVFDSTTSTPTLTSTLLRSAVSTMGPYAALRLPIIDTSLNFVAMSSVADYDFSYPDNEANEIMAYQCAIDFRRKQNNDISLLQDRLYNKENGLMMRFHQVLRRDEYKPERIANVYPRGWY